LPLASTAIQKLLVGHDTLERLFVPSMLTGEDQDVPLYRSALPFPSTAMQKLLLGHETEERPLVPGTLAGVDHAVPL
jgi:hypothetical protein